jgi:uncharacterized protein (TIGR04141 family)
LTFLLLKEGVSGLEALRHDRELSAHVVPTIEDHTETLFINAPPPHRPRWQSYLDRHVTDRLGDLYAAGASAVLFVALENRVLALTFGGGRHLIDADVVEEDFGLKVVLNSVDPEKLRSVDAKNLNETTMHTRLDVSRESSFSTFGLDVTQDLVRAVTGTPRDESLAHRLTGSDALGVTTRAQVPDLPDLVKRLLDSFNDTAYRGNFEFVDYLRPEGKPARVAELNQQLVEALNSQDLESIHLAAPEPLDWMDLLGFRFTTADADDDIDADPRITRYLETTSGPLSLEQLKSDRLVALRASDGQVLDHWSVHKSIVFELESDSEMFVLSGGRWFRVNRNFKERILNEVSDLTHFQGLPTADVGTTEDAYNQKAADALGAACMDKKFVFDASPDKMEICDLLTPTGAMIHVKHRGASSTLSHLFAQGVNSAERLLGDAEFRRQARQVVSAVNGDFADVITEERPDPSRREVVFAVITRSSRDTPLTLPFFSVLSLRNAVRRLRALGCPVSVAEIREG